MKMKNKIKNQFIKRIKSWSLIIVFFIIGAFGVSLNFIKHSKNDSISNQKLEKNYALTPLNNLVEYKRKSSSEAPNVLYLLDSPDPEAKKHFDDIAEIDEFIGVIPDGLANLKFNKDIIDSFLKQYFNVSLSGIPIEKLKIYFEQNSAKGRDFFTNIENINKQFQKINGLNTVTKDELEIFLPNKVYNINEAGKNNASNRPGDWDKTNDLQSNVQYKIGEIDISKLNKQDKVLDFSINDKSDPKNADHEFHLIMNNIGNELVSLLDKKVGKNKATEDINDVINKGKIILRDNKEKYNFSNSSSLKQALDKISLFYNKEDNIIEIIAKPDSKNSNRKPLLFKANDKDTKELSSIGFLDVNLSPFFREVNFPKPNNNLKKEKVNVKNVKKNWPEPKPNGVIIKEHQKATSHLKIHRLMGDQVETSKDIWEIKLWLAEDEKISISVDYSPDTDALTSANSIEYSYDGKNLNVTPSTISLNTRSKTSPENAGVEYTYDKAEIGGVEYARVNLKTSSQILINNKEPIAIPRTEQRIFFEDPSNNLKRDFKIIKNVDNNVTKVSNPTKINASKDEYIKSVFGNWFDLMGDNSEKQWLLPHQKDDKIFGNSRVYDFDYEFYFKKPNKGIVKAPGGTKNGFFYKMNNANKGYENYLLDHDLKTFEPKKSSASKNGYKTNLASGENISKLLSNYFNVLYNWTSEKFKISNPLKSNDFYKPTDPNSLGKIKKKIKENAPRAYKQLDKRLDFLLKIVSKGYGNLSDAGKKYIDNLSKTGFENKSNSKDKIKDVLDKKITFDKNGDEIWDKNAILANKMILMLVEREMINIIKEIFKNENKTFEGIYSSLLGRAMSIYLKGCSGDYKSISKNAFNIIKDDKLSENFKGSQLISIKVKLESKVNSGKAQLKSLLDFIVEFDLVSRYLNSTNSSIFMTHYKSGDILKEATYLKTVNRSEIGEIVSAINEIVNKIIDKDKKIESLSEIVEKIEHGIISDEEGAKMIKKTIDVVIQKITSSKKNLNYKILQNNYKTSYVENLAIGRNLSTILEKWLANNKTKISKEKIEQLKQTGLYDTYSLVNLAISLGYYNFQYFIESLTKEKLIPKAADDMLDSDFSKNVFFKIPKSNSIIDGISNPNSFSKYGLIGSGALLSLVGALSFVISIANSSRKSMSSKKSSIFMKFIFIGITIIGMVISGLGILLV